MQQVKSPFAADRRIYPAGTIVEDDDPVVVGREALFCEVGPAVERPKARKRRKPVEG